ncbi:MAG: exodeoxyribonuclease VII large subunit [Chloroflexi bacterium]|nr:exodeoxyribonuclease VII large subunit [Chloroflexota bacterium]
MIVLPVSNLCWMLRESLESDPRFSDVWVAGEISNLSRPSSGHMYFTLKDGAGQLRCAFFRRENARSRAVLENGGQIVAHGNVSFYEARGDIQLYVDFVHEEGTGVLHLEYERLKERLAEEGLFDEGRKRPLPEFPRRIGVVTSPDGAVFHDICHILRRRWPVVEVLLAPTLVQGDGASDGVCRAIADLCDVPDVDVIIVARGGGSLEDLWTFNDERVARAIFGAKVPVISAVGHETDYTIADFVADLRAPTPSAAAEMVVPDIDDIGMRVQGLAGMLAQMTAERLRDARADVEWQRDVLQRRCPDVAAPRTAVEERLRWATEYAMRGVRAKLAELGGRYAQLHALSPLSTLARGYAVVQHAPDGPVIARAGEVAAGDRLRVSVADGEFEAAVVE